MAHEHLKYIATPQKLTDLRGSYARYCTAKLHSETNKTCEAMNIHFAKCSCCSHGVEDPLDPYFIEELSHHKFNLDGIWQWRFVSLRLLAMASNGLQPTRSLLITIDNRKENRRYLSHFWTSSTSFKGPYGRCLNTFYGSFSHLLIWVEHSGSNPRLPLEHPQKTSNLTLLNMNSLEYNLNPLCLHDASGNTRQ